MNRVTVDIWYPRDETNPRRAHEATEVQVCLVDVRAADSIVIDYDFARDGYRIRMASVHEWDYDDEVCDEGLIEVAFVPARARWGA